MRCRVAVRNEAEPEAYMVSIVVRAFRAAQRGQELPSTFPKAQEKLLEIMAATARVICTTKGEMNAADVLGGYAVMKEYYESRTGHGVWRSENSEQLKRVRKVLSELPSVTDAAVCEEAEAFFRDLARHLFDIQLARISDGDDD